MSIQKERFNDFQDFMGRQPQSVRYLRRDFTFKGYPLLKPHTRWHQHFMVPGEIGRLCADHCSSGLHDSYPVNHTSLDRGGIELYPVSSKYDLCQPTRWLRLRKSLKSYFDEFTQHFENPYRYQNVRNQNIFHLRYI